jgi:hypothetical protein
LVLGAKNPFDGGNGDVMRRLFAGGEAHFLGVQMVLSPEIFIEEFDVFKDEFDLQLRFVDAKPGDFPSWVGVEWIGLAVRQLLCFEENTLGERF